VELQSDLWLDQPDAHERIEARRSAGELAETDAALLHDFVDNGFAALSVGVDAEFADALDQEIDDLWERRPADLAVSAPGRAARPTSFPDYDGPVRPLGYRIPDLHSHSSRARDLYLDPEIFRVLELIFDQQAIAFQSLYFEYGSQQGLHRDPMFVATQPSSHLLAAWIALEDITPESGPLSYVAGSHLLPYFEFEPGKITCATGVPPEKRQEFSRVTHEMLQAQGFEIKTLTCKRGDVFIWHGGLFHGGTKIEDKSRTRRSFVVHYSTAANYKSRRASMRVRNGDGWATPRRSTDLVVERNGARGLENPHAGSDQPARKFRAKR
jgi:ectoine hydroxylase-related dioxygenase (phytanoyl-CoA dioxygenase family)